jgi:hypothetical protein
VAEAWASRAPRRLIGEHPLVPESVAAYRSRMATWDDVSRACLALPGTAELAPPEGTRSWRVRDKAFAWERPLRKKDLAELGDAAPSGPVLAAHVPDEGAKTALIAEEPAVYFTTSHFTGYAAVLCRLDELDARSLTELVTEAWACRAPRRLVAERFGPA